MSDYQQRPAPERIAEIVAAEIEATERELCARAERWETGFRNIVTAVVGARTPFEIPEIVAKVEAIKADRDALLRERRDLAAEVAALTAERDALKADLARAVAERDEARKALGEVVEECKAALEAWWKRRPK